MTPKPTITAEALRERIEGGSYGKPPVAAALEDIKLLNKMDAIVRAAAQAAFIREFIRERMADNDPK